MKFALIKGQKAYELSKGDFKSPIVEIPIKIISELKLNPIINMK